MHHDTRLVFFTAVPALVTVSASEGIDILRKTPSILRSLQENVGSILAVLDLVEALMISSECRLADSLHPRLRSHQAPWPLPRAMHRRSISRGEGRLLLKFSHTQTD